MVSNSVLKQPPSLSLRHSRWIVIAIAALLGIGGTMAYVWQQYGSQWVATPVATPGARQPRIQTVTALGRLEPQGQVIQLSAPAANTGNRVEQLMVQPGDSVQVGQVVAHLDSYDRLQADVAVAQERVKVAQAELARIQAGPKQGEIAAQNAEIVRLDAQRQGEIEAQRATIARLEAERHHAEMEFNRYQLLYEEGAISASQRDARQLTLLTAQRSLQEAEAVLNRLRSTQSPERVAAQATLDRIAEVRPVDVDVAQANVDQEIAAVKQAQAQLKQAIVRAPQPGVILEVHTRPGELVASDGIVEIGQTRQMYAVAEVYESDVSKIKPGQRARITSDALPQPLQGTVDRVSARVHRQAIINTDPSENIDARVVDVYVRLTPASSRQAAQYTNLQVNVVVNL